MTPPIPETAYYERHLVRLLIGLYYCGKPMNSLLEGEMRQIDSIRELQRFDFWLREPGHLALALLYVHSSTPGDFVDQDEHFRATLDRALENDNADFHRVPSTGGSNFESLNDMLSFLASRALLSDRPSFTRSRQSSHQIVLEATGITFVTNVFETCPSFRWYRAQAEAIVRFFSSLEKIDLTAMNYLAPDLNSTRAAAVPLVPFIRQRYESIMASHLAPSS